MVFLETPVDRNTPNIALFPCAGLATRWVPAEQLMAEPKNAPMRMTAAGTATFLGRTETIVRLGFIENAEAYQITVPNDTCYAQATLGVMGSGGQAYLEDFKTFLASVRFTPD